MKTIYTREFDDKQEADEFFFELANYPRLQAVVWDYGEFLRTKVKYTPMPDEEIAVWERAREKFYELIKEYGAKMGLHD